MFKPLPTLTVLGQDYTVDVQARLVRNTVVTNEIFSFDRFQEIVETAAAIAEETQDPIRLAEARSILRTFDRLTATAPQPDASITHHAPTLQRGDAPAAMSTRHRRRLDRAR
jgi:hypothetical protein